MSVPPFRCPVPEPLHPPEWERPAGNLEFRVTQTFDHVNLEFSSKPHGALDLGNGRLGAIVTAAADGKVIAEGYLKEPWSQSTTRYGTGNYGGIMAVIDHGNGWTTVYAHLSATVITAGQAVKAGQYIGTLGDTGSAKGQGHLHFEVWRNGVRVDPWPLLAQNYVAPLPDTSIGGNAMPTTAGLVQIVNRKTVIGNDVKAARFRADATRESATLAIFEAGTVVIPVYKVSGEAVGGDTTWYVAANYVDERHRYEIGCYHASVLDPLEPNERVVDEGAVSQAEQEATARANAAWRKWLDTAPKG